MTKEAQKAIDELLARLREEQSRKDDSKPCPSCGHCPTCGRGGHQVAPWLPYTPWYRPYQIGRPVWMVETTPSVAFDDNAVRLPAVTYTTWNGL